MLGSRWTKVCIHLTACINSQDKALSKPNRSTATVPQSRESQLDSFCLMSGFAGVNGNLIPPSPELPRMS